MSGPFYSRYIPPIVTSPTPVASSPKSTLSSTQPDASSTCARYIPPASLPNPSHITLATNEHEDSPPAKRVKRIKQREEKAGISLEAASNQDTTADVDSRHRGILAKREKSLRKAQIVKSSTAADDAAQTAEVPAVLHALNDPLPQPEPVPEPKPLPPSAALPEWVTNPVRVSTAQRESFSNLGLHPKVVEHLREEGFESAFAVQAKVLPLLLTPDRHHDVLVSAASGSGKTLAYVLPIVKDLSNTALPNLRCIIVLPTRELVHQARHVCEIAATAFASTSKRRVTIGVALGNQTMQSERAAIMKSEQYYDPVEYERIDMKANAKWITNDPDPQLVGEDFVMLDDDLDSHTSALPNHVIRCSPKVDILLCTPGRIVEHLKTTPGFTLDKLKWLVIDEADKLLNQSFQRWREELIARLPEDGRAVTKILVSATMTKDLSKLPELKNDMKLRRPKLVIVDGQDDQAAEGAALEGSLTMPPRLCEWSVKVTDSEDKPLYLLHLLQVILVDTAKTNMLRSGDVDTMESRTSRTSSICSEASDDSEVEPDQDSDDSSLSSSSGSSSEDEDEASSSDTSTNASSVSQKAAAPVSAPNAKGAALSSSAFVAHNAPRGVIIFTKSNESASRLSRLIALMQPSLADVISTLTSTVNKSLRRTTLRNFTKGKTNIIVASDLVARGLDLHDLAHVVNYDVPTSLVSYVHRVGRTARGGKEGQAWTLNTATEAGWFWAQIGRSPLVQRAVGMSMKRYNIDEKSFSDGVRKSYAEALETLGKEAHGR